jgi:hypothetical protein
MKPAMAAATKMLIHTGTPKRVVSRAEPYAPKANNAPWPSDTCPWYPTRTFRPIVAIV